MNEMQELVNELNKHCYNYYVLDLPTISDGEFDKLYDKLVKMEKETGIILPDSPTQRIGGEILESFEKYSHKFKLYSLNKCQSKEELAKWYDDIIKVFPEATFTSEYKFDGLSLVCTYKNGMLQSAGTRGNGSVGENVTEQAKTIKSLPLKIKFKGELIVQGEAMITLSNLKKFNAQTTEQLKNARNAAAGALRNLNPKETAKRKLDWFVYTVHYAENKTFLTQKKMMEFLQDNGFNIGNYFKINHTLQELYEQIDYIEKRRLHENILLDGVVIRLNQIPQRDEFGFTAKYPKWAIAYKFEAQEVSSILKNIIWQVGRTGKITPIAEIEPVQLAGATIQRATLNNMGDIEKKQVEIGSRVFIRRSNEVIPEILGLAEKLPNSKKIITPTHCPCCNTKLVEDGANLFCPNTDGCRDQIIYRLTNFVSKNAMDIEGLSISSITKLYDKFDIKYFHEIYELTGQEFMVLDGGYKEQRAKTLEMEIQKSKKVLFNKFLYGLAILGVGTKTAKDLAKKFQTFDELKNATYEEILQVYNIGEVIAKNIYNYFHNEKNIKIINKLFEYGIEIIYENNEKIENSEFENKLIVLTGTLKSYTRQDLTKLLEKMGAQIIGSVSKNTDIIIAGENPGSKLEKAKTLGTKIIYENKLLEIIDKIQK